MRKPRNRSDFAHLPTGLITFPANAAFGALATTTRTQTGVVGVKHGKCVVAVSCEHTSGLPIECQISGHCPANGVVMVQLTHAGSAPINHADLPIRYIVFPT
jgi:hypothetical protein